MIAFESGGYCDIKEYKRDEKSRLTPDTLYVDEVYMLMMIMRTAQQSKQAAKQPSRIQNVEPQESGLYTVRFQALNSDLQLAEELEVAFNNDGYWVSPLYGPELEDCPVKSGYFKGYADDFDFGLMQILDAKKIEQFA